MSDPISAITLLPAEPARTHSAAPAVSAAEVSAVDALMGVAPAQVMETIMLRTGVPMPAHLGQDVDMSV